MHHEAVEVSHGKLDHPGRSSARSLDSFLGYDDRRRHGRRHKGTPRFVVHAVPYPLPPQGVDLPRGQGAHISSV